MKALITEIAKRLVDNPDEVNVTEKNENGGAIKFRISCAEDDLGKIIGKRGGNISAIRTIIIAIAAKEKKVRAFIDIDEQY